MNYKQILVPAALISFVWYIAFTPFSSFVGGFFGSALGSWSGLVVFFLFMVVVVYVMKKFNIGGGGGGV